VIRGQFSEITSLNFFGGVGYSDGAAVRGIVARSARQFRESFERSQLMASTRDPMLFPTTVRQNYKKPLPPKPSKVERLVRVLLAMVGLLLFAVLGLMAGLIIQAMHIKLPRIPLYRW
jgi:hypothetical protein